MNIDIRKSIIKNFEGSGIENIRESIETSIEDNEEITLPGLGVFFEILWNNSDKEDKEFTLKEWELKTKEEKQNFIARYIESVTLKKNNKKEYGLELIDIKFKSLFKEKLDKVLNLGSIDIELPFEINGEEQYLNVSSILTEDKLDKYLEELKNTYGDIFSYQELQDFEKTIEEMLDGNELYSIELKENEELYKLIPVQVDKEFNIGEEKYKIGILGVNSSFISDARFENEVFESGDSVTCNI